MSSSRWWRPAAGRWATRAQQAWVDVPYSTNGYQIGYRDSAGLDYDGERIHRNYNRWVPQLDADIRRQLQLPAPTVAAE